MNIAIEVPARQVTITESRFRQLLIELIDENPFAIRAVLRILEVEFTPKVQTLAVTCEERPRLLVNLDFVATHCRTDAQVKAVICHEFLHVLLRHTEQAKPLTAARHLAFDAVINAIIHRELGDAYSSLMSEYYADSDTLQKLLRPMTVTEELHLSSHGREINEPGNEWIRAWEALYAGRLVADDIEALAKEVDASAGRGNRRTGPFRLEGGLAKADHMLLGDHESLGRPLQGGLADALDQAMKQMNGSGIWRSPKGRGIGANPYEGLFAAKNERLVKWRRRTYDLLKRHATPDRKSRSSRELPRAYRLPVLSSQDRRAALKATWTPFLPEASWTTHARQREGSTQIYLDVSGSMSAEMPLIIGLLGQLGRYIRRPFWAFSDVVAPAVIENGILKAQTTGGTSMSCVIEHVLATRPEAAVVVTDGYIEALDPRWVKRIGSTRLHVLVTRDGNPAQIHRAGLPYTQLEKVPK